MPRLNMPSAVGPRQVAVALLVVASLASFTAYVREGAGGPLHSFQTHIRQLVIPLDYASGALESAPQSVVRGVGDLTANPDTLSGLRKQNEELKRQVAELDRMRAESAELRRMLGLKERFELEGTYARVISRTGDNFLQGLLIDKGTADGVKVGDAVMAGAGLLGQVVAAAPHSATIRLLTSPASGVAVTVQSNHAEGIVRGGYDGLLHLDSVPASVDVKPGDVLFTSGLGGSFPRGLFLGYVLGVEGDAATGTRKITVSSAVSGFELEGVFVVSGVKDPAKAIATSPDLGNAGQNANGQNAQNGQANPGANGQNGNAQNANGAANGNSNDSSGASGASASGSGSNQGSQARFR